MLKKSLITVAILAACSAHVATAAPVVDGALDPAYGPAKSTVTYDPAAPESNFGAPTASSDTTTYQIYLTDVAGTYYGFLKATPPEGKSFAPFANLYFDLDPQNGNGSDIGIEVTNSRAFIAGGNGTYAPVAGLQFAISADGTGIEFSVPNTVFTSAIPGLTYADGQQFAAADGTVVLRLSQSFGYSVAGGSTYGDARLGAVTLVPAASAVPEPTTVSVMGLGMLALLVARRRRSQLDA